MVWENPPGRGSDKFGDLPEIQLPKLNLPKLTGGGVLGVLLLALGLWLVTGVYKVDLAERGVLLLFGKFTSLSEPGLHWYYPYPFGRIIKVGVEEVKRVEIGFRTISPGPPSKYSPPQAYQEESLMLTRNTNMIDIDMSVQYRIDDPVKFLFNVADRQRSLADRGLYETVKNASEAALREVIGRNEIDAILTTDKSRIQLEIQELIQKILDLYGTGIKIQLVQLQDVHPPFEVRDAFKEVNNAEEDKNRMMREAEGYFNAIIPETRGEVAKILREAEAYQAEKIKRAEGDASRFTQKVAEYEKAKDITRQRLYLEAIEEILRDTKKIIVDRDVAGKMVPIFPFGGEAQPLPAPKKGS